MQQQRFAAEAVEAAIADKAAAMAAIARLPEQQMSATTRLGTSSGSNSGFLDTSGRMDHHSQNAPSAATLAVTALLMPTGQAMRRRESISVSDELVTSYLETVTAQTIGRSVAAHRSVHESD